MMAASDESLGYPALMARMEHWRAMKLPALREACIAAGEGVSGNKTDLCLRLALRRLPADVGEDPVQQGGAATDSAQPSAAMDTDGEKEAPAYIPALGVNAFDLRRQWAKDVQ